MIEAFFIAIEHHRGTAAIVAIFLILFALSIRGKLPW